MDTPIDFSESNSGSSSGDDEDHGFSESDSDENDSGYESFDTDFDPETLQRRRHTRVETPQPSLKELEGILEKLDLDDEFMLQNMKEDDDDEKQSQSQTNNKRRSSIKHTECVSETKIGKKWYINQYLCYKYLGRGSFGKVCLAKDIVSNKKLAIKVLNKSILRRKRILRKNKPPSNLLENIFREIAIMKKLDHPNVLQIHEVIDDPSNDKLYMVIDYMDSGSVLGEQGAEATCEPITDHELIRKYIRHMILGLDYLHSNHIIHGDIKPENLLLSNDDHLKIADFGVSFMLDEETCPNKDGKISRSQGTPAFTAPETGAKSFSAYPIDIWAMGVTLYMMITGVCPFAGNGILETYEKIQNEQPPIPTDIDQNMRDFLEQILQKDPDKRITLKQAMTHQWITKNGTDPLSHPKKYQKKTQRRVSVTKDDIEHAVSLRSHTIQRLRRTSVEIQYAKPTNATRNKTSNKPPPIARKLSTKQRNTPTEHKALSPKTVESNSNISPSFAKRRTGSDISRLRKGKMKGKAKGNKPKPSKHVDTTDENNITRLSDGEAMDRDHTQLVAQLEQIVDKEMTNLASLYDKHMADLMCLLPSADTCEIISCPLPNYGAKKSNSQTPNHDPTQNHDNMNSSGACGGNNNEEKGQNTPNNNDSSGDKYEKDASMPQSTPCNHLNTCSYCRLGWTQKCEQNKIFKGLLLRLQTQHAHHVSFVEMLCNAIANAKQNTKKSKFKSRRKTTDAVTTQQPKYDPSYGLNVKLPKALTDDIIPQSIKDRITPRKASSYVKQCIAMQHKDKQLHLDQNNVVVDVDFHEAKSNEPLYCIMSKTKHQQYNWQLESKLYTAAELSSLGITALPQSPRMSLQELTKHSASIITKLQNSLDTHSVDDIIRRCKWKAIPVSNITNNTKRVTLSIEQGKLNPLIKRTLLCLDDEHSLIPILVFGDESYWVEHVVIVGINMSGARIDENQKKDQNITIGVSLRRDTHGVRITGIHLDKEKLSEQHQLFHRHECDCLDGFKSNIHDIRVGNPDADANKTKDFKRKYNAYKKFILCFINSGPHKYDAFQHQAQVLLMNQNGTLTNVLKSMDLKQSKIPQSPLSSISSSPDCSLHTPSSD